MKYVLGVDGGNSKTDYLLHDLDGRLVRHMRASTCSHESLGMEGAQREMKACVARLLEKAGVSLSDIAAAAFGLAGVDQAEQKAELEKIVLAIGFQKSIVMNDSFLGIKAGSETGVGICFINGTGTAAGGIDGTGKWVQVGGYGYVSGDEGGGVYIAKTILRAAYDAVYRFGPETLLLGRVCALLGCAESALHDAVSTQYLEGRKVPMLEIIGLLFSACDEGDAVALGIMRHIADCLARSAAGCAVRLSFERSVPVVLIGSVWTKGLYQPMIRRFQDEFEAHAKKEAEIHILAVPPATGSVLWALELATGEVPARALRQRVIEETKGL